VSERKSNQEINGDSAFPASIAEKQMFRSQQLRDVKVSESLNRSVSILTGVSKRPKTKSRVASMRMSIHHRVTSDIRGIESRMAVAKKSEAKRMCSIAALKLGN
jgi:hypothetical protein